MSSYVYDKNAKLPTKEDEILSPQNPYALTKVLGEEICSFFNKVYGVNVLIIRPFNLFGPGQNSSFLIPSIISQALKNKQILVKDLAPKRDYLYIEDLSNAIKKLISYQGDQIIFNLGYGKSHSVKEVIDIIQSILKTSCLVKSENLTRKMEIMDTIANIDRAKLELGWEPLFSLEEGLKDLILKYY